MPRNKALPADYGTGGAPPPAQISFDAYLQHPRLKTGGFDAVFDLRNTAFLTPVKGQTNNSCWAFATMAAVESQWLKLGLGATDLSENNLKFCNGFDASRNDYGNHFMATAYFARRQGPLAEADDPNSTGSTCPTDKIPLAYIADARYLPHDMDAIKQAIMDHGAIFAMMYFDAATYFNATNNTYYYNGTAPVNHVIDLVGWDDNKATAGGTGAWICRNSYGPGWGENGYFYIGYNCSSFLDYNAYWPTRTEFVPTDQVYGYDDLGNFDAVKYGGQSGFMLVKFTASQNQLISKLGTYAMSAGAMLSFAVYDHFDPQSGVLSGLRTRQDALPCEMPGYYTTSLDVPVPVKSGNVFYVLVRYQTPGCDNPIPIEEDIEGYAHPAIESDIAWIGYDESGTPKYWLPIGNTTYYKWDPCVKAYAESQLSWSGSQSSDWSTAANWDPQAVPGTMRNVDIPSTVVSPVIGNLPESPALCKRLTLETGASLTLAPGTALTVNGTLTNHAGAGGLVIENGASLITLGEVNGQASIKQVLSANQWHCISPPVNEIQAGIFAGQYLQQHHEATNAYTYITSVDQPLTAMTGYAFWSTGNYAATYSGYPNTGTQSVSLQRTAAGNTGGWNLVGNPYPSAIDWDAPAGWTRSNIGPATYIENKGDWATYISASGQTPGTGTNGGSNYIAPGQGFFVNVPQTGAALLRCSDQVRIHHSTPLLKQGNTANQLRLTITGNGYADEAIVRFIAGATVGFDLQYDAMKLFGNNLRSAQLYTLGADTLAINSLPPGTGVVSLGVYTRSSGTYTLYGTAAPGEVMLLDKQTGQYTDLGYQPYTFSTEAGHSGQRFSLYFGTLSTDPAGTAAVQMYTTGLMLHVQLPPGQQGSLSVSNLAGQYIVSAKPFSESCQTLLPLPGIYIVKLLTATQTRVQKIMAR